MAEAGVIAAAGARRVAESERHWSFTADRAGMTLSGADLQPGQAANLLLSGRRIWSFRIADQPERVAGQPDPSPRFFVPWPAALQERLHGSADLSIESRGTLVEERRVRFDESGGELVLEEPGTGIPLIVNKWGRITRSFEGRDPALLEGVLDEAERLIAFCSASLGIDLFVIGGTLLGPVRDGRIMPHDDDADLAYLSRHDNPSDIALESYDIERALVGAGYEVVRHSTGHLQIMFPGGTIRDRYYIDIFTYFVIGDWFYGTFHARSPAADVRIIPLGAVDVNGRMLPAPADPESLLTAIYGASWRVPDPAFTFVTPPAAARRFFWWLNHYDVDRENWEDLHRVEIDRAESRPGGPDAPSAAVIAFERGLPPSSRVLELGAGLGGDARYLAAQGHDVVAVDYSRPALVFADARSTGSSGGPVYHRANLNDSRDAARVLALVGGSETHVFARGLFDSLPRLGRDVTLGLMRDILSEGEGRAFVEVESGEPDPSSSWTAHGPVDWGEFRAAIDHYGFTVDTHTTTGATGATGTDADAATADETATADEIETETETGTGIGTGDSTDETDLTVDGRVVHRLTMRMDPR